MNMPPRINANKIYRLDNTKISVIWVKIVPAWTWNAEKLGFYNKMTIIFGGINTLLNGNII